MPIQLYRYYLNSLLSVDGRRRPDDVTIQHYYLAKATPLQACLAIVASRTVQGIEDAKLGETQTVYIQAGEGTAAKSGVRRLVG